MILVLALIAFIYYLTDPGDLISHSLRNPRVLVPDGLSWFDYAWKSDREILAITGSPNSLWRINTVTGKAEGPLAKLGGRGGGYRADGLSPNARWCVVSNDARRRVQMFETDRVAESRLPIVELPVDDWGVIRWRADSRRWVLLDGLHNKMFAGDPDNKTVVRIPGKRSFAENVLWYSQDDTIVTAQHPGVAPWMPKAWTAIDEKDGNQRSLPFTPPGNSDLLDVRMSPDGKTVLWELGEYPGAFDRWMEAHGLKNKTEGFTALTLYVSRLDGTNMRLIGSTVDDPELPPAKLVPRWLPDSRHISLLYKKGLYTLAIPSGDQ